MWKKVLIALFTMIGTFSVIYAFNRDMFATGSYQSGGNVTGRIHMPPSGMSGNNFGMQKGDKIMMGASNPSSGNPMAWQLIEQHTYTDYGCVINALTARDAVLNAQLNTCKNSSINAWKSIATEKIGMAMMGFRDENFIRYCNINDGFGDSCLTDTSNQSTAPSYTSSGIYQITNQLYSSLSDKDKSIIRQYDLTQQRAATVASAFAGQTPDALLYSAFSIINSIFFTDHADVYQTIMPILPIAETGAQIHSMNPNFDNRDYKFYENYLMGYSYTSPTFPALQGVINGKSGNFNVVDDGVELANSGAIRPLTYINTENIVFGISSGTSQGYASVTDTANPTTYTDLYKIGGEPMKVRLLNTDMIATFNKIQSKNNVEITKVSKDESVYINADANAGGDAINGYHTVSVLVFNEANHLIYYKPLTKANGLAAYEWDTTGLLEGKYKVAIVNEVFDATSTSPADSSAISSVKNIEIVTPLSNLKYEAIKTSVVYGSAEAKGGQAIGKISSKNGVGTPIYKVIEDPAHVGEANEFEVGSVNVNHEANVLIKGKSTDSIKAGTYHFLVQATDENGDPDPALTTSCTITVEPLSNTLAFKETGTQEMQIHGSTFTGTISYTNIDSDFTPELNFNEEAKGLLTVVLNADKKTYTVTPASIYTGIELPKTFTLTLSGKKTTNYTEPVSVTKSFTLYKGLSALKWTPSSSIYPVDKVTIANITVGDIVAEDGVPNFTYSIVSSTDNMFKLEKITGKANEKINVNTTGKLFPKTYTINFEVKDQKGLSKTVSASINVTLNAQSKLYFVNASGTDITNTGQSIAYGSTGQLQTKGGNSTKAVTYALAPAADQPSSVGSNASDYVTIGIDGKIIPKKVGTVKVMATKPADDTYSATTAKMNLTITAGGQSITWPNLSDTAYHVFDQGKTFTVPNAVLIRDDITSGSITYSTSTIGVCTISGTTITMKTTGTCVITASNKDANYKAASKTVNINLYTGISGNYTSAKVNQGSNEAKAGSSTPIANITLVGGDGTYKRSAFTVTKDSVDMTNSFTLSGSEKSWKITPAKDLKYGTYDVSITYTDGNGGTAVITGTITVGLQSNTSFKLVDGTGTDIPNNVLTKEYEKDLTFYVTTKGELGNGIIHYYMSDDSTTSNPAVTIHETSGQLSVSRLTKADEVYKVYAAVEEDTTNGYAKQTTQEVIIKITEGTQSISFDPSTQEKVQFKENGLFEIKAILTRKDGSTGTITYESTTSTICEITSSNKVKMLDAGTCTIKASNQDENYQEAEETKSIVLYNQATGSFKQVTTPQAEVDAKADTALGTFTGEHGKGTLTYENSTDSSVKNQGASLIKVESDGTIRLKQDVSAADLASLATYKDGFYQVNFQVVIKDDGQEASTVDCVANIKGAPLADVRFKDEVNGIITKTFGDTFVLALLNNPGGTPTYSRKADDTLPKDVIDEKIEGSIVKILHANDPKNANLPVIIANIPAANGYDAKEISTKVSINKAKQDGFKFRDENLNMKTESVITPLFEGAKSSEGITITSGDEAILTIVNGDLKTAKKTGTVTVTATANADRDYESKTITKDIIVYDNLSAAFKQKTPYPQANTDSAKEGTFVGQLSVDGGQGTIKREVITGNEFIILPSAFANIVKLNKDITAEDLKGKWNDKVKAYVIKTEIKFTDTLNDTVVGEFTLPVEIYFRGAPLLDVSFADDDGKPTKLIQKPYVLNGDFLLTLTGNTGEGAVKYHLKDDDTLPSDVLAAVDEDGTAYIDNANDKEANANDVIVQADIEPSNGYEGTTVECVVEIMKAKQDFDIKPKDQDIEMKVNDTKTVEFTATPKGGTVKLELKEPTDSTKLSISGTAITAQETGTVIIKATAPGGRNYEDVIREKNVIIYDDMNVTFTQDHIPQAETDTAAAGIPVGTIKTTGGIGTVSAVIDKTTLDGEYFKIDGDSIIIDKAITVDSIKDKWNEEEKAYIMNVTVKLTDSKGNTTDVIVPIKIQGAPLTDVAFKGKDGKPTYKIVKTYSKAPFKLELVDNSGGGSVTYKLKENVADMPTDVIKSITESGTVTIDNANEKTNANKVWAIAEIGAKNGYDSTTIEAEIYIEQAPQPNFKFKEKEVTLDYHGTMDTILQNKLSSGEVTYSSGATGIATIDKNGTITAYTTTGDAIITAICKEDRNYLSATATMIVHVIESEVYPLVIEVPSMTYGDSPVQAEIKQQGAKGENLTQTWTSSDESIASIDDQGNITAHHAGTVTITLSQTSDGEPDVSTSVTLIVKPKPIEITIDNKEKLVGEEVPKFTIQPIEGLVGNDTFKAPELSCKDQKNSPVNELTPAGTYKIKGTILPGENPDYTITKINEGTLVIKEDKSTAAWYRLESEATRTSSGWYNKPVDVYIEEISTPYDQIGNSINGPWSDHFTVSKEGINETDIYFRDSNTKAIASKQVAEIKIDMHDPKITSITGSKTNTGPLAKVINTLTLDHFYQVGTEIEIVAEDPKPAGVNTISEIERIEYKLYRIIDKQKESEPFKEGTAHASPARISIDEIGIYDVCATTYDHAGNKGETCQEIEMVKKEEPEEPDKPKECQKTDVKWSTTDDNGKAIWYTMNEDTNKDGIPDMNIDSDGDGKPDINVDTDDDGKPDVNLVIITKDNWKPKKCVTQHELTYESHVELKPIINVDLDIKSLEDYHDAIPDINIDTDGDMKADFNIDINNDGKADVNIGTVHTPWKPNQDYTYHGFVYDTSIECDPYLNIDTDGDGRSDLNIDTNKDGKPDLNIDITGNGIPDTNIDTTGDGKPDVNVDTNHDGEPDENIFTITEWKPGKDVNGAIAYDTMEISRKDALEDQGVIVEDSDGQFLPNFAIKVTDITDKEKETLASAAKDQIPNGKEVKAVYDVKLLKNNIEIEPDGTVRVKLPLPDGITNPKVLVKKSDGSYELIDAKVEAGYLVYETKELGVISIIGDQEAQKEPIDDSKNDTKDIKDSNDTEPKNNHSETVAPKTSVQGHYGMGGAITGDYSNMMLYIGMGFMSFNILSIVVYKKRNK